MMASLAEEKLLFNRAALQRKMAGITDGVSTRRDPVTSVFLHSDHFTPNGGSVWVNMAVANTGDLEPPEVLRARYKQAWR